MRVNGRLVAEFDPLADVLDGGVGHYGPHCTWVQIDASLSKGFRVTERVAAELAAIAEALGALEHGARQVPGGGLVGIGDRDAHRTGCLRLNEERVHRDFAVARGRPNRLRGGVAAAAASAATCS